MQAPNRLRYHAEHLLKSAEHPNGPWQFPTVIRWSKVSAQTDGVVPGEAKTHGVFGAVGEIGVKQNCESLW